MKKFVALLLALALMVTCAVSAMASAKQWVDIDVEGYKVEFLFNYNECVAVDVWSKTWAEAVQSMSPYVAEEETFPHSKTPTGEPAKGADPLWDVRYVISSIFVAGYEANEVVGNGSDLNVVPVDLTVEENTCFVYPIATKSHVVIGLLYAKVNVEEGFVQIEGQLKDEIYSKTLNTLTIYTTKAQLNDGGDDGFPFAEPISIEEELGGAPAILVAIDGKVTYPTYFGPMWSTVYDEEGKPVVDEQGKVVKVMGTYYAYQDYYRNERWAKTYRTNMSPALALVAD